MYSLKSFIKEGRLIRKDEGKLIELKPESYFKFYSSNGSDTEVSFKKEDKILKLIVYEMAWLDP